MTKLLIAAFPDQLASARKLETALGAPLSEIELHEFPDGETLVRASVTAETVIIYCSLDHPNQKLVELGLAAAAFRDLGVRRLTLAAPYLCYMRVKLLRSELSAGFWRNGSIELLRLNHTFTA